MAQGIRENAREIFLAGVAAADPKYAVLTALDEHGVPDCTGRLLVVALGKAAVGMMQAAQSRLDIDQAIVVTNYENATKVPGTEMFACGHPVPDENGLAAGLAVEAMLGQAGENDHVLVLVSGGGSALLPTPLAGISLADKARVNQLLLGAGMEIARMNPVRQQLSRLKGGGFVRLAHPAGITAFILSDVVGDDLAVVASGPTVAPIGNRKQACRVLKDAGIWGQMPPTVMASLQQPDKHRVDMTGVANHLIGSNAQSVSAMAVKAPSAIVFPHALAGDVADAAQVVARCKQKGIWLFGGETTVHLTGKGMGGRNQELALRVAIQAEKLGWDKGWVFLSGGTDGRDGPTDAAGGMVDAGSLDRMRAAGVDPLAALADNDSYHALQASGDLLITGATGTNVADLQVLIRV